MKIGMMSYPCGEYEQITPSHLFKSVNHTYIILILDTAYQTKDKSCKFDTGTATARCIIKFGKNLFNFVCRAVAAFVSARQGTMYKLGAMMIKIGIYFFSIKELRILEKKP